VNRWTRFETGIISMIFHLAMLILIVAEAQAAPSAPPCGPVGDVGVELRPTAYVVDYHFTEASSTSWSDPDNWSYGSWAEEAAGNAGVPVSRPFTCLNSAGDSSDPFTSYPRVIIDAGKFVHIDAQIDPIGELVVEADAMVFVITNLTEFLSDFANVDIGKTLEVEGQLLLGQGLDMPLPDATLGSNGMNRLGQLATATVDADALFQGTGEF
jgi:hypothetical protein